MRDRLDSAIFVGLLVVVVFTALAFGSVERWAIATFELAIIVLAIMRIIKAARDRSLTLRIPGLAMPLMALLAYGLIQAIAYKDASGQTKSLSMDVEATRATLVALFTLLLALILFADSFATRRRLRVLESFAVIYGLGLAVFAILQHLSWDGRFYWLRPTEREFVFGPFVNHNHFAGYMEMLIPIPLALIITRGVRPERGLFYGFAAALMGLAAVMSLSRGGMIGLAASMIFMLVMAPRLLKKERHSNGSRERGVKSRLMEKADEPLMLPSLASQPGSLSAVAKAGQTGSFSLLRASFVLIVAATIIAGVLWIGPDPVVNRIAKGSLTGATPGESTFYTSRGFIWLDSLAMIRANPVFGAGLGAFETAYPIYSEGDGSVVVSQAHNDYLQIVADCGIVGGVICLWLLVTIFRSILRSLKSPDPFLAGMALGSSSGIFAILVHSIFDFNLQIPSNALLFLALSAIVFCVAETRGERVKEIDRRRSVHAGALSV